jgi:hypothetical protein
MQHVTVFVDRIRTRKDQQIANHVPQNKSNQGQPGKGDEKFFSDG